MATETAPTIQDLLDFCPDLACFDQDALQKFLDRAACRVDECYYGPLYNEALLLMAAHLGSLATQSASGTGAIKRKKAGDLEIEYDTSSATNVPAQYSGTRFGIELWGLMQARRFCATPKVI